MKQLLQNLRDGTITVADVPAPRPGRQEVLIRTSRTLVSAGTERMLVEFGRAGLVGKARRHPDRVRQVVDKARTDGVVETLGAVRNKLDQPLAPGYCNVGRVMETGGDIGGFEVGDRVASNGGHAEVVAVPANLCARVPEPVSDAEAAFTVLGAIALQGIRLAVPTLGETVVVTGLGLVGMLAVQLLKAQGCRVLGIDPDPEKRKLAERFGAQTVDIAAGEDPVAVAERFSRGRGVDAVLITASTKSNEPVRQAAHMCRKRGRIVLVGVTGLKLSRDDFYEKELTFQVSCSYGPGRHDPDYEDKGQDYPVGFVRWTEQRNFEAVLDMMADGRIDVKPLISHRFSLDEAGKAYDLVAGPEPSLGILFTYPGADETPDDALKQRTVILADPGGAAGRVALGFIGAGNYAASVLIPAFGATSAKLIAVASAGGVSCAHVGRKFGFEKTTTDSGTILSDTGINTVVIATRHDSHAELVCRALAAGKHVFVEKPLALTLEELAAIETAHADALNCGGNPVLMVGFNRRFAPHVRRMSELLDGVHVPKVFVMTVNAGAVSSDHWTQDAREGGGRIIGEACHFIDLLRFLAGSRIAESHACAMASPNDDTATIQLKFDDGTIGSIHYLANGSRSFPKERLEVFAGGRILRLDNFRRLKGYGWPGAANMRLWRQDKGQKACAAAFVNAVEQGGPAPIAFDELVEVSRVTIEVAGAAR